MKLGKNFTILIVAFTCIVIGLLFDRESSYTEEYNSRIKTLETKIDSLYQINDTLNIKIYSLTDSIKKVDIRITGKDKEINKLKDEINSQINSVNSFSNGELQKFFTDRYR